MPSLAEARLLGPQCASPLLWLLIAWPYSPGDLASSPTRAAHARQAASGWLTYSPASSVSACHHAHPMGVSCLPDGSYQNMAVVWLLNPGLWLMFGSVLGGPVWTMEAQSPSRFTRRHQAMETHRGRLCHGPQQAEVPRRACPPAEAAPAPAWRSNHPPPSKSRGSTGWHPVHRHQT